MRDSFYEKAARKMFVKLTPGINSTNFTSKHKYLEITPCFYAICHRKSTGAKAVFKMMMKLTPAVNFINNLRTNFLYKTSFWQLFSRYMNVKKMTFVRKICTFMLMKLTPEMMATKNLNLKYFSTP